jgi:hypothetical protein
MPYDTRSLSAGLALGSRFTSGLVRNIWIGCMVTYLLVSFHRDLLQKSKFLQDLVMSSEGNYAFQVCLAGHTNNSSHVRQL